MEVNNNNWLPIQGKYYDIDIDLHCRTYEVVELDEKSETALTTLEKIEKIIDLNFKPLNLQDPDKILKICRHIHQNLQKEFDSSLINYEYLKKINAQHVRVEEELIDKMDFIILSIFKTSKNAFQTLSSLTNLEKMKKINALHIRIERTLYPSTSLPGLEETIQLILNFLPFKDLNTFCEVNRNAKKHGDINVVQREKKLGIARKISNYDVEASYSFIKKMFKEFHWINRVFKLEEKNNFENIIHVLKNLKGHNLFKILTNVYVFNCAEDPISFIANQKVEVMLEENQEEFSEETVILGEKALLCAYKKKLNLDFLLKRGAVINVNTPDCDGNAFLHLASKKNDYQLLKELLVQKTNINCQNSDNMTPLHLAKSFEVAKLLIENGADVQMSDNWGRTALHFAKNPEIAMLLIEKGADINVKDRRERSPLHFANTPELIEFYLKKGLDINECDIWKATPLHHAVINNYGFDCVKLLLDNGAASDCINSRGNTALAEARYLRRSDEIIKTLELHKTLTSACIIF